MSDDSPERRNGLGRVFAPHLTRSEGGSGRESGERGELRVKAAESSTPPGGKHSVLHVGDDEEVLAAV